MRSFLDDLAKKAGADGILSISKAKHLLKDKTLSSKEVEHSY